MEIMMHSVPNLVPSGGAASLEMRGQGSAAAANLALDTDAFVRIRELEAALRARADQQRRPACASACRFGRAADEGGRHPRAAGRPPVASGR